MRARICGPPGSSCTSFCAVSIRLFYRFTEVSPGEYTICAAPLSERGGKLAPLIYPIEGFPPELSAYCEIVTIRDDDDEQTVIIEVEPVRK